MRPNTPEAATAWINQHHDKVMLTAAHDRVVLQIANFESPFEPPQIQEKVIYHSVIHGDGNTKEEAWKEFWKDYDRQVKPGGNLYWRRCPEMVQDMAYHKLQMLYTVRCKLAVDYDVLA